MFIAADLSGRIDGLLAGSVTAATPGSIDAQELRSRIRSAREAAAILARPPAPEDQETFTRAEQNAPDWEALATAAEHLLRNGNRTVEAAVFLAETWAWAYGFWGFAAGNDLIGRLIERHWPDWLAAAQDAAEAPSPQHLLAPLQSLAAQYQTALRFLPLFALPDGHFLTFDLYEYAARLRAQAAREKSAPVDQKNPQRLAAVQRKIDELGIPAWEGIETEVRHGQADGLAACLAGLKEAAAAWDRLGTRLAANGAKGAVRLDPVRDLLGKILAVVAPLAPSAPVPAAPPETAEAENCSGPFAPAAASAPASQPAISRESALRTLGEIADFFRTTEPQSPIAPSIDEVVRRARLSFPELLAEILPKPEERNAMLQRLGIRPDGTGAA